MSRAESILSEISQHLKDTVDELDVQHVISKAEGSAYAIEQEADGTDRAYQAVTMLVEALKEQLPSSKWLGHVIIKVATSPISPLLLREQSSILHELHSFVAPTSPAFKFVGDENGLVGDRLKLSFVYWLKDRE